MTKEEIFSLLTDTESAQKIFLVANNIIHNEKGDKGEVVITESLSDLAFRLRDEVPKEKYLDSLNDIRRHYQRQKEPYTFIDAYKFVVGLTSIEVVCTALLAGLEDENE